MIGMQKGNSSLSHLKPCNLSSNEQPSQALGKGTERSCLFSPALSILISENFAETIIKCQGIAGITTERGGHKAFYFLNIYIFNTFTEIHGSFDIAQLTCLQDVLAIK